MNIPKTKNMHSNVGKYYLIFLIGFVAAGLVLSSSCYALDAQFDWSVSEGFKYFSVGIDDDGDGLADNFNYLTDPRFADTLNQIQHNYDWVIDFDACASTGTITKYKWTYENFNRITNTFEIKTLETSDCKAQLSFGKEGTYNVTLKVSDAGNNTASITKQVIVQDWLIVATGDDWASGEGNPDVPSALWNDYQSFLATISPMTIAELYEKRNDPAYMPLWQTYLSLNASPLAGWTDTLCHRSQNSGFVLAGKDIASCDNKTSVTFVHLACSGAIVARGLTFPYQGVGKLGFFDYSYCDTHSDCIPPQIEQARQLVGSREIDAMLTSIGANDVYLFPLIYGLLWYPESEHWPLGGPIDPYTLVEELCGDLPVSFQSDCAMLILWQYATNTLMEPAVQFYYDKMPLLPFYYAFLDAEIRLHLHLPADRIYITELPDITKDENGNYCCSDGPVPRCSHNPFVMMPEWSYDEMAWADMTVTRTVNTNIHANTAKGWNVITGIYDDFYGHGYCSADSYLTKYHEAWMQQGVAELGFFEPNSKGYEVYRNRIAAALREHFYVDGDCTQGIKLVPKQPAEPACPDGLCNGSETCATCPQDCGVCPNNPPVANAGPDRTVERTSPAGAQVQLAGSGSSDPDGDPLTYEWTWAGGSASGVNPTVTLPMGQTTITLTVSDGDLSATDEVVITVVDSTPPQVSIITPQANVALQDGVTLQAQATDTSGIDKVFFYVREPNGGNGIPIGYEDLAATYNSTSGYWEYAFDTTRLQDGYYVILAKAIDNEGNEGKSSVVAFSIRNWAVIQKLPSTPNSKAGRTMPVKFSLRIARSVDPAMPFVYNEDLEIRIYRCDNTSCSSKTLMQTSRFGTGSTDYRINTTAQLYQTNFQTTKTPAQYLVEIWRPSHNFLVGSFTFKTVK